MMCMKIILLWCVAVWGGVRFAEGSAGERTVRFFAAITDYYDARISECMPEHSQYNVQPNQNISIEVFGKNVPPITNKICTTNKNIMKYKPQRSSNISQFGHMDFIDVGNRSCKLMCIYELQYGNILHCQVQLKIGQDVDINSTVASSVIDVTFYVGGDLWETKAHEVGFFNNTKLSLICKLTNNVYGDVSMIHRTKNGATSIMAITKRNKFYVLNETHNGDEIICIVNNQTTNFSWETVVKLKYREGKGLLLIEDHDNTLMIFILIVCIPMVFMVAVTAGYYYRTHRGPTPDEDGTSHTAANGVTSLNIESHAIRPESNIYAEVYNVVYEDQHRIERLHEAMRQSERPAPPSVDTIPIRVAQSSSPPPVEPLLTDTLISPSDQYLLNIDSEGYEIPDEMKFVSLQRNSSEGNN